MINIFQPDTNLSELLSIAHTLESKWIGKGEKVKEFEWQFAHHLGVSPNQIVSTNSCTEALFQLLDYINVKGMEVIIPSIHFIGADNAIRANGGIPIYCDVDYQTLNTSIEHIEPLVTNKTVAIILLHYGGYPCDIQPIMDWSGGIIVIEDAATAIGAKYHGQPAGTLADYSVWSFDAMKTITCGDGGMIYCADDNEKRDIENRLYLGTDTQSGLSSTNNNWWEYTSNHPARRSIMNDISASIGLEQLKKLPKFLEHRQMITSIYSQHLGDLPLLQDCQSGYYFYWVQSPKRDELAHHLRDNGIYTTFKYWPLHKATNTEANLPNTERVAKETLLLPLHTGITYYDAIRICELINEFLQS